MTQELNPMMDLPIFFLMIMFPSSEIKGDYGFMLTGWQYTYRTICQQQANVENNRILNSDDDELYAVCLHRDTLAYLGYDLTKNVRMNDGTVESLDNSLSD